MEKRERIGYVLFGLYLFINLILVICHEPWRDEAQVWLLARDLPLWRLPGQMAYEGHPCLWHLLIFPFAKLGLPYYMQNITSCLLVAACVWLLLFRSPFCTAMKAVLIFSPLFTYYYPVIARSYCMIPVVLCVLAYCYPERHTKPFRYALALAILVQTHAIMIVTAFCMCLCFLSENLWELKKEKDKKAFVRKSVPLFLPFFSALFLLYQLMSVEKSSLLRIKTASAHRTVQKILEKTMEAIDRLCGLGEGRKAVLLFAVALAFAVAVLLKHRSKEKYRVLAVILPTFCFQFWFYAMVYDFSVQRLMTFPLLILWGMWILHGEGGRIRAGEILFCACCVLMALNSLLEIKTEIEEPYSGGREAAAFIRANLEEDAVFITDNQAECTAIFPYLGKRNWLYGPNGQEFSFVTWDDHWMDRTDYDSFKKWLDALDSGGRPVYLISCFERSYIEENERMEQDFPLVFQSFFASVKGEDYKIYKVR